MNSDSRLSTFVAVLESGSFTGAARGLGVSQPAVSQCIRDLESEAGGPLLVRGRGGGSLTPLGEVFARYARRILALYGEMGEALAQGAPLPQKTELELSGGITAEVTVDEGKIQIALK